MCENYRHNKLLSRTKTVTFVQVYYMHFKMIFHMIIHVFQL